VTRIRLVLLLVAVGLGVPVAVLAWRALDGLALERGVRHQALAERAFDEMERALSAWLEDEEARPFEQYRFYAVAPDQRSPLAELPAHDFVIGAFQIDPDGSVHTPLRPADLAAARARGDWPPDPEVERRIERITRLVEETWRSGLADAEAELGAREDAHAAGREGAGKDAGAKTAAAKRQDPGTTRPVGGLLGDAPLDSAAAAGAPADDSENVYQAIQRLNRGAEQRAERKQKIEEVVIASEPSRGALAFAPEQERARVAPAPAPARTEADEPAGAAAAGSLAEVAEPIAQMADAVPAQPRRDLRLEPEPAAPVPVPARAPAHAPVAVVPAPIPVPAASAQLAAPAASDPIVVRAALDPMVGRPAGDAHLLVYRTVLVGTGRTARQGYRQGLVLDRAKLGAWLAARALGPTGLSQVADLAFDAAGEPDASAFVFQHRFAEPFDAVTARLSLTPLPGVGQPGAIYALVALLALVGVAGLLAVERMVAVAVHFAERRNNFVSAVTHELKTPLTAIRMYAEMLRDGLVASEAKRGEYYGTITDESERLSRLIDNVLEFSRLSRGTREMDLRVGAVGPVLEEAADKLRAHAAREGFALEVEVDPGLPPVRYDRDALLQVLFNLVDNAMKYAREAPARRVLLEARRSAAGVELSVRDFGPGVAHRHLPRIFEPFYRGEDELVRSTRGTGIGLALVRELAQRMGAAVRGANAEGGGFRVCLAFRGETA
jgi:signal transduction histidine kinase